MGKRNHLISSSMLSRVHGVIYISGYCILTACRTWHCLKNLNSQGVWLDAVTVHPTIFHPASSNLKTTFIELGGTNWATNSSANLYKIFLKEVYLFRMSSQHSAMDSFHHCSSSLTQYTTRCNIMCIVVSCGMGGRKGPLPTVIAF